MYHSPNVKPNIVKLLEENIEESLCKFGLGTSCLGMTTKA